MKTQAKKDLNFTKTNVVELNEDMLSKINGGDGTVATEPTVRHWTTPFCGGNVEIVQGSN